MNYHSKYLKYKKKYLNLKGGSSWTPGAPYDKKKDSMIHRLNMMDINDIPP